MANTQSEESYNPRKEYKSSDNIMCHYYGESDTMRTRTKTPVKSKSQPIIRKQRRFKSI